MRVIARAYGERPLDRVATGSSSKLIYVANASAVSAIGITPFSGVGFPKNAVFRFESDLFESLQSAWEAQDHGRLKELWGQARLIETVDA